MTTTTKLGDLAVEQAAGGVRPAGIALGNDGLDTDGWLSGAEVFALRHDETGWVLSGHPAHAHHTVRLWNLKEAGFATFLPLDGTVEWLDPNRQYALQLVDGAWGLYRD